MKLRLTPATLVVAFASLALCPQVGAKSGAQVGAKPGAQVGAKPGSQVGAKPGSQAPRPSFDAFDVATIKLPLPEEQGRYIKMVDLHRFVAINYSLKLLIAAAYNLSAKAISGGPSWIESEKFDITAVTPGDVQPTHDEQMAMLRNLLVDRFKLTFHREQKDFALYELQIARGGPKLKPSGEPPDSLPQTIGTVFPGRVHMPARNVSMADLCSLLQRAIVDRPVVDRTGLSGKFDFDLDWAPDQSEFGGDTRDAPDTAPVPPLFTAMQQELGLKLEATHGPIAALVIEQVQPPSAN
jgi:uncharacterized protein (TIGR03435 family)